MDVSKFIGIPYEFGGDGYGGTDCLGLCRLFYKEHGWSETFRDGRPILSVSSPGNGIRLGKYLETHFKRITKEELKYGDIVLFNVFGDPHTGIYIGDGNCLSMQIPCIKGSRSMIYHKVFWDRAFTGAFGRR